MKNHVKLSLVTLGLFLNTALNANSWICPNGRIFAIRQKAEADAYCPGKVEYKEASDMPETAMTSEETSVTVY